MSALSGMLVTTDQEDTMAHLGAVPHEQFWPSRVELNRADAVGQGRSSSLLVRVGAALVARGRTRPVPGRRLLHQEAAQERILDRAAARHSGLPLC